MLSHGLTKSCVFKGEISCCPLQSSINICAPEVGGSCILFSDYSLSTFLKVLDGRVATPEEPYKVGQDVLPPDVSKYVLEALKPRWVSYFFIPIHAANENLL